jgi:hypothetical protein
MLKLLFITFSLLTFSSFFAQDAGYEVRIRHFQRKAALDYLPLPNMEFQPTDFDIKFPDSLYSQAQIEVKKLKLTNNSDKIFKKAYIILASKKKRIYQVNLAIHPKYEGDFENYLMEHYSFKMNESFSKEGFVNETKNILVEKEILKKQINYKFSIPKD